MAKRDKYVNINSKRINGRILRFPVGTPKMERDGVEFIAAIFARAHAENPDENWISKAQPWVRAAIEMRG